MTETHTDMQIMQMIDTQTGIQTHVLGLTQSVEVQLEEGVCSCNYEHYGLKEQVEGRLGIFVQPERPIENI